jgi:WhiB family redox-sensing transcriptional regulator
MDWRHTAVCRDEDPELFFPVGNSGPALAQIADAKLVCNRCPVTTECLSWALNTGQDSGVWGGMSEDERRALKRRNARTKARTVVWTYCVTRTRRPIGTRNTTSVPPSGASCMFREPSSSADTSVRTI